LNPDTYVLRENRRLERPRSISRLDAIGPVR
jgi:hypothetical protein